MCSQGVRTGIGTGIDSHGISESRIESKSNGQNRTPLLHTIATCHLMCCIQYPFCAARSSFSCFCSLVTWGIKGKGYLQSVIEKLRPYLTLFRIF